MSKYVVNVIAHQLKNNEIAVYGQEVDESQLTRGSAEELLNAGFIVKASDFKKERAEEKKEEAKADEETEKATSKKEQLKADLKK